MIAPLLRRMTKTGFQRGMAGSRVWLVVAIVATGLRVLRFLARDSEEVLYRTAIEEGDTLEVVATARR